MPMVHGGLRAQETKTAIDRFENEAVECDDDPMLSIETVAEFCDGLFVSESVEAGCSNVGSQETKTAVDRFENEAREMRSETINNNNNE